MRNVRANVFRYLIVAVLFLAPFSYAAGNETSTYRTCSLTQAEEQCGENERCVKNTKDDEPRCECQRYYKMVDGHCSKITTTSSINVTNAQTDAKPNSGGSSVAAGLLIPTFLVVIGVLLYFGARRYKWLQRFRQFRQNRYGNVLVTRDDDDDDDPPIA